METKKAITKKELTKEDETILNTTFSRECAYARVSTDTKEQKISYESQKKYYEEKIKSKKNTIFIGIYADEAISGGQAKKRPDFMRMINDAKAGKIDKIYVKNISRFARNTIESIKYARELRDIGVSIYFEEEGIDSLDRTKEFIFTILSATAEQELYTTSEHVRYGLRAKMLSGRMVGTQAPYGYIFKEDIGELIINDAEAKIVKMIFNLRIEGNGCRRIANILNDKGIPSATGGKWVNSTLVRMLKNEKYCGDLVQGKKQIIDPISKKQRINRNEEELYVVKDHHIPIIDKDTFKLVQEIVKESANKFNNDKIGIPVKNMYSKYGLTSKIKCGFCGKNYLRRQSNPKKTNKKTVWACNTVIREGKQHCSDSLSSINEETLKSICVDAINTYVKKEEKIISEVLNDVKKILEEQTDSIDIDKIKKEIVGFQFKLDRLLNIFLEGSIDKESYLKKKNEIDASINEKQEFLDSFDINNSKILDLNKQLKEISEVLHNNDLSVFDDNLFRKVVDKIIIGRVEEDGTKNKNFINIVFNLTNSLVYDASEYMKKRDTKTTYKNKRSVKDDTELKVLNVSVDRSC